MPAEAAPEVTADGEIGWVELDDISQVGDLDDALTDAGLGDAELGAEREYTFEEADAATLAELGLTAQPSPPEGESDAEAAKVDRPPTTRRRARTARAAAGPDDAAEGVKPSTGRRRGARPASRTGTGKEATAEAGGEAPAGRTRAARPAKASTASTARTARSKASDPPEEEPKKPRARSTRAPRAKAEPASDQAEAVPSGDGDAPTQGIWQRFRGGRTPSS